jgi:adenylyltransferase/sulfurtransferase
MTTAASAPVRPPLELGDEQLLRYNRQIMLPEIGVEGQERLWASRVLLVGLGGLGSPIAMYLAASGVGHLVLVDHDAVDLSNLQRQIVHTTASLGEPKVRSAARTLDALNPEVRVDTIGHSLGGETLGNEVAAADVVVEATDNFEARRALNRACLEAGRPLVSGAVIRMEGQVAVYRLDRPDGPCYECLHGATIAPPGTCADSGVLGSVAGIIGTVQATEVVKTLLGIGEDLDGRVLVLDALRMEWQAIRLRRNPRCPACGARR